MKEETFNRWFSVFVLIGMSVALVVTTAFKLVDPATSKTLLLISAFGSLMGVLSSVASANGRIISFLFGLLDVSIYGVMCFVNWKDGGPGLGTAILHMVYFVPMQFIGFAQWRKRGADTGHEVKARRLSGRQRWIYAAIFAAASIAAYLIIARFDKSSATTFIKVAVVLDVLPLVCNILGQLLLSTAYLEQWVFWIGVNVFSIAMWTLSLRTGNSDFALIYIVKYSFYLLNSINGFRIWLRLSR